MDAGQFSVLIPTRNRGPQVTAKVLALLEDPLVAQVVVVVDGCTDDTEERLRALTDDRVELVVNPRSAGTPRAKNQGLSRVAGDWIAELDDDDQLSPGFLQRLQATALAHDADVVCAPWFHLPPGADPLAAFAAAERHPGGPQPGRPGLVPTGSFVETIWGPSNLILRRRVIDAGVRFDEGFRFNFWREETAFLTAAARAGFRVGVADSAFSYSVGRLAGGIDRRSLGYELWTVLNDIRFVTRYGRWLKDNGQLGSRIGFVWHNGTHRAGMRLGPALRRLRHGGSGT